MYVLSAAAENACRTPGTIFAFNSVQKHRDKRKRQPLCICILATVLSNSRVHSCLQQIPCRRHKLTCSNCPELEQHPEGTGSPCIENAGASKARWCKKRGQGLLREPTPRFWGSTSSSPLSPSSGLNHLSSSPPPPYLVLFPPRVSHHPHNHIHNLYHSLQLMGRRAKAH